MTLNATSGDRLKALMPTHSSNCYVMLCYVTFVWMFGLIRLSVNFIPFHSIKTSSLILTPIITAVLYNHKKSRTCIDLCTDKHTLSYKNNAPFRFLLGTKNLMTLKSCDVQQRIAVIQIRIKAHEGLLLCM